MESTHTDLRVAEMVDDQLSVDLSWTSRCGKEVFIGSRPPGEKNKVLKAFTQLENYCLKYKIILLKLTCVKL